MPIETVVKRQTHDVAELFGLTDRGVIAPGMKYVVQLLYASIYLIYYRSLTSVYLSIYLSIYLSHARR